jgi:ferrous iron transport protein B
MNPERHTKIVLVGQPNCGKSTLFNEVAGYKSIVSNFSGATVEYTESHIRLGDTTYDLIDLPGIYSLTSMDEAERETLNYLMTQDVDVLINVLDASTLSRSLELTLQLLELEVPMVVCLNMMDEAERKGIDIDLKALSEKLGVPVAATTASRGLGVNQLFTDALSIAKSGQTGRHVSGSKDVEDIIQLLEGVVKQRKLSEKMISSHLFATKLLEGDPYFTQLLQPEEENLSQLVKNLQKQLEESHGRSADEVISAERHILSMDLFEAVTRLGKPHISWRDRLDNVLMHNIWGYVFMITVLVGYFNLIFKVGGFIEHPLITWFENAGETLSAFFGEASILGNMGAAALQGIGGGVAIVLPYLVPFLLGLALMEDAGYLPRVAFLMDGLMHKIGLHGKAIIPAVLGYGCNVPAVMATRILHSRRDRFIAALIAAMVPCAARMTIIFGLVGYYLGGMAALSIYLLNILVIGVSAKILSRLLPEVSPGMVFDMPVYQVPRLKFALKKTWFRLKDFVIIAWPLLIAGSMVLAVIEHYGFTSFINGLLSPLTRLLGLPVQTGMTLIFGVLRKELSMLMLFQAMGTQNIASVMSPVQILVFTVFIVFYIPCVATIGALAKQISWKPTVLVTLFTLILAVGLALFARVVGILIW